MGILLIGIGKIDMSSIYNESALVEKIMAVCDEEIRETRETVLAQAMKDFETRLRKDLAKFTLTLLSEYHIERQGNIVTIRVEVKD